MEIIYAQCFAFIVLHWVHAIDTTRIVVTNNIKTLLSLVVEVGTIHTLRRGNDKTNINALTKIVSVTSLKVSSGIDVYDRPKKNVAFVWILYCIHGRV